MLDFFVDYITSSGLEGLYGSLLIVAGGVALSVNILAGFFGVPRTVRAPITRPMWFGFFMIATLVLAPVGAYLYWKAIRGLAAQAAARWSLFR